MLAAHLHTRTERWNVLLAGLIVALMLLLVRIPDPFTVTLGWLAPAVLAIVFAGTLHMAVRRLAPAADPWLLGSMTLLMGTGLTLISRLDAERMSRQVVWILVAAAFLVAVLYFLRDHRILEHYQYVIGIGGLLALVVTVGPLGSVINGSKLWITFGSFQIQPGEFAKLAIVIFLAAYLRENREMLAMRISLKHLGPLLLVWGASLGLLVLMRDFGTSLLFFGTFLLMVYVATGRAWYVSVGTILFAASSWLVVRIAPHVATRFEIWLDPWQDAQGSGYQLIQGLFAMADGGLFGRGLGRAFLVTDDGQTIIPDAETDFIFAVAADDLGMLGAVLLLMVYAFLASRAFTIAARANDGFSTLLAFGLGATFALQTITIVGGVVRLLPLTGQTLPFVSYGGSSLLANAILVALLLRISDRSNQPRGVPS